MQISFGCANSEALLHAGLFAQHKVATNLVMSMTILSGLWALSKLNTQFFPNFVLVFITVCVVWTGATAEDMETAITVVLEQELYTLDGLHSMTPTSAEGVASISLEYEEGTNMGFTLDQVKAHYQIGEKPLQAAEGGARRMLAPVMSSSLTTIEDMRQGMLWALVMIYLVLAWVFASYGWPLVVMIAIPFGLTGALVEHWLLDIDLTILSLFGLFGLSGIVVNDSIILVTFYKHLREQGMETREAIIDAACQRPRAVLLTSLSTIAGLTPLLFETSLQAQSLIPVAVSLSFGLAFATVLLVVVLPTLLSIHEGMATWLARSFKRTSTIAGRPMG